MFLKAILVYVSICFLYPFASFAQNIRTNRDLYFLHDLRKYSDTSFHTSFKPYSPDFFSELNIPTKHKKKSQIPINLLNNDLISFYSKKNSFIINPILSSVYSYNNLFGSEQNYNVGLNLKSTINGKLYFTTNIIYIKRNYFEIQENFIDSFSIIPYMGNEYRSYNNYFDLINYTGELTIKPVKSIYFHLGIGKHFIGNGYHSLFLSDNSNSYPYIKTTVDIWRIKYIWLVAKLKDYELYNGNDFTVLYDKAAFLHYLSLNLTKNININFFEAIISNPYDLEQRRTGYEVSYFNPVIFFRPTEFYTGSSDNSVMGVGLNLSVAKSIKFYSQFLLDDLVISSLSERSGWWGNKFGIQIGIKTYNLFNISGLFARYEFNYIRPYTYSHGTTYSENDVINLNYGHFRQSMTHPLGANFMENLIIVRYKKERFLSHLKIMYSKIGSDTDSISYGNDIYKVYNLRPFDYGIKLFQGQLNRIGICELSASYILNPSYYLLFEAHLGYFKNINNNLNKDHFTIQLGISTKLFNEDKNYRKYFRP